MNFTDKQKEAINHLYRPAIVVTVPEAGEASAIIELVSTLLKIFQKKEILTGLEKFYYTIG